MPDSIDPSESRLFLGLLAERLSELIERQTQALFQSKEIIIPPKSCSLMLAIAEHQPATVGDLARALDRSHQLLLQKLPKLQSLGLIERHPSQADARKKLYVLTEDGRAQLGRFRRLQPLIENAYERLAHEAGDVDPLLRRILSELQTRPLLERIRDS